jgi:hypothetical protein
MPGYGLPSSFYPSAFRKHCAKVLLSDSFATLGGNVLLSDSFATLGGNALLSDSFATLGGNALLSDSFAMWCRLR